MQPAAPARTIPVLPSPDLGETQAFYVDRLGFEATLYEAEMEIHFWRSDDRKLPEVSSCYIRGGGIFALHAEYAQKNLQRLSPIAPRPWGMTEFYVWDPHGNLLRFGNPTEQS